MAGRIVLNDASGEIELFFDSIPSYETRDVLKGNKFRWDPTKKCWHAPNNYNNMNVAKQVCDGIIQNNKADIVEEEPLMLQKYCFKGTLEDLFKETEESWITKMKTAFPNAYLLTPPGISQINAWKDCYRVLVKELSELKDKEKIGVVFEYSLPYESGRRPDVLLIANDYIFILEFKMKNEALRADIDQVDAYARDLTEYHFESREKTILPFLVITRANDVYTNKVSEFRTVIVCSGDKLNQAIIDIIDHYKLKTEKCDLDKWINSRYEPLPTIVEAARMFMQKEELPNIRRVNSTGIPQAMEYLHGLADRVKENKELAIVFVTGVPGAGKTFLGLQYVYDVCENESKVNSVYLSGNGPLIKVLENALQSKVFVKDLHRIINDHIGNKIVNFDYNVVVFDEGQRAWNNERMAEKCSKSEPEVMIDIAEKYLEWGVLLILVGEGQEINKGENAGIEQWDIALRKAKRKWTVVCPNKLSNVFKDQKCELEKTLDLTVSLRTHLAGDVSTFVNNIMNGNIEISKSIEKDIKKAGFDMLITRDLGKAKMYCDDRYCGNITKRYGLIASSKSKILPKYGVDNTYYATKNVDYGSWYNTSKNSGKSCCNMKQTVTEFGCQGLELDMPIVCWDTDMIYNNGWQLFKPNEPANSENNLYRINSYRVLLTRGRDGFIIFVPPVRDLDGVYNLFKSVGVEDL